MLEPLLQGILTRKNVVLASASSRRKELLKNMGLRFEVIPSEFDEGSVDPADFKTRKEYVLNIAEKKVDYVFNDLKKINSLPDLLIGADTIVELDGRIFGKPRDEQQAVEFLKMLNGKAHCVHTAVVLRSLVATKSFVETTKVFMASLTDEIIKGYVETKDPLDKAGAYGIQNAGGSLIERIEGDYYNVMGLPLHKFCVHVKEMLLNEQIA